MGERKREGEGRGKRGEVRQRKSERMKERGTEREGGIFDKVGML